MYKRYVRLAKNIATAKKDDRVYRHGAVGVRKDGAIVASSNGNPKNPDRKHHAEYRVIRKLGKGGELYVIRVLRDGTYGDSTPCIQCQKLIRSKKVKVVYYSDSEGKIRSWHPATEAVPSRPSTPTERLSGALLKELYAPNKLGQAITGLSAWLPTGAFFGLKRTEEPFCGPPEPTPQQKLEAEYRSYLASPASVTERPSGAGRLGKLGTFSCKGIHPEYEWDYEDDYGDW